jgi:hypothetical protein
MHGTATDDSGSVFECEVCNMQLPLRSPKPGEAAVVWRCVCCEAAYQACYDEASRTAVQHNAFRLDLGSGRARKPTSAASDPLAVTCNPRRTT